MTKVGPGRTPEQAAAHAAKVRARRRAKTELLRRQVVECALEGAWAEPFGAAECPIQWETGGWVKTIRW